MRHLAHTLRLDAYADGELRGWRLRRAQRHLGACATCRAALQDLRASRAAIAELLATERAPGSADAFWAGVRRGIAAERPVPRRPPGEVLSRWLVPFKLHPRWAWASAALASMLLAGVGFWRYGDVGRRGEADLPAQVESLEGGPRSTVMLFSAPHSRLQVIWVFERPDS